MTVQAATRVIALQKVSAPDYLHHVFAAWRERAVIVPTDDPATLTLPDRRITERLMVEQGGGWFEEMLPLDDDPAPAQISFTSGTSWRIRSCAGRDYRYKGVASPRTVPGGAGANSAW